MALIGDLGRPTLAPTLLGRCLVWSCRQDGSSVGRRTFFDRFDRKRGLSSSRVVQNETRGRTGKRCGVFASKGVIFGLRRGMCLQEGCKNTSHQFLAAQGGRNCVASRQLSTSKAILEKVFTRKGLKELPLSIQHTLQQEIGIASRRWRRERTVILVSGGILLGAGIFGTALYFYLDKYPSAVEFFVVEKAVRAFDTALSFESKKKIYLGLPDSMIPNVSSLFFKAIENSIGDSTTSESTASNPHAESALQAWGELVQTSLMKAEKTWLLSAKMIMRKDLEAEIKLMNKLEDKLSSLSDIYQPSVERNLAISQCIEDHAKNGNLVPGMIFEQYRPHLPEETCDISTSILIHAIAFFPGPINSLIHFLDSPIEKRLDSDTEESAVWDAVQDVIYDLDNALFDARSAKVRPASMPNVSTNYRRRSRRLLERTGLVRSGLEHTFAKIKLLYDDLSPNMREYVLKRALKTTITHLPTMPRVGGIRPYDLYVRAIEMDLIGPLRRDARITEDILSEVKGIFLAMPPELQTRVLLTALLHPLARTPVSHATSEAQAELVRDLLSSGGVVAIKLAQMLAEHPRMPKDYQQMLGSLRDDNPPMPMTKFWWNIPSSIRGTIAYLGACIGTGSVKQANIATFSTGDPGQRYAVVVLREGVEDEALSSILALQTSNELGPVATRLGRLVYGEFDLFGEGEVLDEFAATQIGLHPQFHVVKLRSHSPRCLVEEVAPGVSVAAALEEEENESKRNEIRDLLTEYHKTVMKAFVDTGVIHSDIHLGNAHHCAPGQMDALPNGGFVLFDVGQFERIGVADAKALLWTLAAMSSEEHRVTLKEVAITHLAQTSSLKDKSIISGSMSIQSNILKSRLDSAFSTAISPLANGEIPDKRTAYMLFLREAELNGIEVPKGAFSVAKMIDGIVSQQEKYGLSSVVDETIERFLKSTMSWGELAAIAKKKYIY